VIQFALWQHAEHIASAVANKVSPSAAPRRDRHGWQSEAQSVLDQLGSTVLVAQTSRDAHQRHHHVTVTGHAESIVGLFSLPVKAVATGPTEPAAVAIHDRVRCRWRGELGRDESGSVTASWCCSPRC